MRKMLTVCILGLVLAGPATASQVIAVVGDQTISSDDLELAIASSPFATQFATMDENQQASLRGDLLQRLVASRLLYLEAKARGIDQTPDYLRKLEHYRIGLLYRAYIQKLRDASNPSKAEAAELHKQYRDDPDAEAAAKAQIVSGRYKQRKDAAFQQLHTGNHAQILDKAFDSQLTPETVLARFDGGQIRYGDIKGAKGMTPETLRERVAEELDVRLAAKAAEQEGLKIEQALNSYHQQLLAGILISNLEREWIPNDGAARAYFTQHPEIGRIPAQRHVLQIVVADRKQADDLHKRLTAGENFYQLAVEKSIDPYGRKQAGDMGWHAVGSAMPEIEKVLADLPEGQLSPVVKTSKGFHILKVLEQKPAYQKTYEAVMDRVRQAMILEHYPVLMKELQARYPVEWKMPMMQQQPAANTQAAANKP